MKPEYRADILYLLIATVFVALCMGSCTVAQNRYQRKYNKIWKEIVKSKAWQESLSANENGPAERLYASTEDHSVLTDVPLGETAMEFNRRYASLVSKAYFRIITQAEKADARITAEFKMMQEQAAGSTMGKDRGLNKEKERITKKYKAHRAMLEGLKSWNIFSPERSGDLDYFKAENRRQIMEMMRKGATDNDMENALIYKLADLYHNEE